MICALISPTFSFIRSRQSFLPAMIASRASLTHAGHRESVCRGKPSVGLVFSQDLSSGLSDHCGVTEGFGLRLLKCWMLLKVMAAVLHSAQSIVLRICVPTRFGIKLYPRFQKMRPNSSLYWMKTEPSTAPRPGIPYHSSWVLPISLCAPIV